MKFKKQLILNTNGQGYWSDEKRKIRCTALEIECMQELDDYFTYRLIFNEKDWNIHKHGLIYTDALFLKELKKELKDRNYNGSKLDYTEQGMQGKNYVSIQDDGTLFKSFMKTNSFRI